MPRIKPAYKTQAAPKVVSQGSVSKPKKLPKWHPTTQPADAAPRVVNPWPKGPAGA